MSGSRVGFLQSVRRSARRMERLRCRRDRVRGQGRRHTRFGDLPRDHSRSRGLHRRAGPHGALHALRLARGQHRDGEEAPLHVGGYRRNIGQGRRQRTCEHLLQHASRGEVVRRRRRCRQGAFRDARRVAARAYSCLPTRTTRHRHIRHQPSVLGLYRGHGRRGARG